MGNKKSCILVCSLIFVVMWSACDPLSGLENQEYRPIAENYQQWEIADAIEAFNHFDSKRSEFSCQSELEKAQRAIWREEAGGIKVQKTPEGKALSTCLESFHKSSGLAVSSVSPGVLNHWVNHNFVPKIKQNIEGEVAAIQKRLEGAGCIGEQCKALTIVDDLAVLRSGLEVSVAWQDARDQCANGVWGDLRPWRLPTRDELVKLRESKLLASDTNTATYWSGTREFDGKGNLTSWVLRFDVESLFMENVEPVNLPFEKNDRVSLARVRCVFDLDKTPPPSEIDELEKALVDAGCPRRDWDRMGNRWDAYVRVRDNLLISWKNHGKSGRALRSVCKGLGWCKLRWKTPSRSQQKKLADDPWFSSTADKRCVAKMPR